MDLKNNIIGLKTNKKGLAILTAILYGVLLFCFQPKLFVKFNVLNVIYIIGLVLAFVFLFTLYGLERKKPSLMFYLIVVYRASFFIQTVLSKGDVLMWGYMSVVLMSLCLVIDYFITINARALLNAIINVLTLLLTINVILAFIYPKGIIADLQFIGIRTRLTDVIFPLVCCSLIYLFSEKKYNGDWKQKFVYAKTAYILIISLITIIQFRIATAFVGIGVFIVAFFVFFKWAKLCNVWFTILAGLLANYLVVFLNITQYFEWFISGVLGKSMTLSSRTNIWSIAIDVIRDKLLFGYGMADNGGFVYWGYTGGPLSYWQAHNQWLQLLYDGGLLTLLSFVMLIAFVGRKFKHTDKKISSIVLACVASFMVMMITEIYSYTPYFFLIIFLSQYLDLFKEKENPTASLITPEQSEMSQ